ncbi:hypothetical protein P3X46_018105 [Hevea brasiliensis]|uniref:Uncharacterized protein n=1 Tax=Hevea brasiliensis TaxID=3981 RepID=A0ABQ9LPT3_HEVBR|nr:hypothetical protein P3X46_018105 [Hevea brasiliensis]
MENGKQQSRKWELSPLLELLLLELLFVRPPSLPLLNPHTFSNTTRLIASIGVKNFWSTSPTGGVRINVIRPFGWMVPAIGTSLLLGIGPKSFFIALAVPLGLATLSLLYADKVPRETTRKKADELPKQQNKGKLSRTRSVRDTLLLLRLLIAVFPLLGSWQSYYFGSVLPFVEPKQPICLQVVTEKLVTSLQG